MAISVEYYELAQSPVETRGIIGLTAERKLVCDWGDRDTLRAEILADPNNIYPYFSSGYGAIAIAAKSEPLGQQGLVEGGSTDLVTYPKAVVTVKYSTTYVEYDGTLTYKYIREELRTAYSMFRTVPWGVKWATSGVWLTQEDAPADKLEPRIEWRYQHLWMASIPVAIVALTGKCNASSVTSPTLGVTFAAQTLLYAGIHTERTINQTGSSAWNITHTLIYNPNTWNKFFRPFSGTWDSLKDSAGNAITVYQTADFSVLF